ncbi:uncharacterized protein LOC133532067 [Cydia pomonella]|uniref:uncharacterized protein LOC133532067 n=1 Tax=Cydia pomonella TaxID=82600 RepID=UPI002ADDEF1A|nr:uncharacterized protein LOC133532067 [Cydia pomonella]
MDEDIAQILHEWGLSEYYEIFKQNKITLKTFNILDQGMIQELIKPIGDRATFISNLNLWKQILNDDDDDFSFSLSQGSKSDINVPPHRNVPPITDITNFQSLSGSSSTNVLITYTPKLKQQALLDILNKSAKGRSLLNLHKEEGMLSSNSRRKLCNIIVEDLLSEDPDVRVTHETLLSIAHEIKNIFPKENISTYFVPYVNNYKIKVKTCAKGKLYDCLHNRKREYREAVKKNNTLKAEQVIDGKQNLQNQNDKEDDAVKQHIIWLQNSIEPWRMVEEKWRETASYRLKCLNTSDKTIVQYMTEFPALKNPSGYTLLTEDFKTLYPDKESLLHEKFCLYKDKILRHAKQKATRDESLKKIIEKLENISEEVGDIRYTEAQTIIAYMVLPLLLGNPLAKVKKKQLASI